MSVGAGEGGGGARREVAMTQTGPYDLDGALITLTAMRSALSERKAVLCHHHSGIQHRRRSAAMFLNRYAKHRAIGNKRCAANPFYSVDFEQ